LLGYDNSDSFNNYLILIDRKMKGIISLKSAQNLIQRFIIMKAATEGNLLQVFLFNYEIHIEITT